MTLRVDRTLDDGATVVKDDADASFEVILKEGQFEYAMGQPDPKATALQFKQENGVEWERERGPNSQLAQEMEAGTPTTAHDSEQPHNTDAGFSGQQTAKQLDS